MLAGIPLLRRPRGRGDESGFTLVELLFATLIFGLVISVAAAALVSLSTTANRNESMVSDEQAATGALAQMARDIRSANSLTFPSGASLANTADEVELVDNQAGGGSTTVMWVYNTSAATLTREVLVGSTFKVQGAGVPRVANPSTSPLLSYFDGEQATNISSTTVSNIEECTTAITVDLYVAPSASGTATIEETDEVAMPNQLTALSAGGSQC